VWDDLHDKLLFTSVAFYAPSELIAKLPPSKPTEAAQLITYVFGSVAGLGSVCAENLADDPPDPNFKTFDKPVAPAFRRLTSVDGLTGGAADAANSLPENTANQVGTNRSLLISLNREDGALAVGDASFETQQMRHAQRLALDLADLQHQEIFLRADLQREIEADPRFLKVEVTVDRIAEIQSRWGREGIPEEMTQELDRAGADAGMRQQIIRQVISADTDQVARLGGFPMLLTDGGVIDALRASSAALEEFSEAPAASDAAPAATPVATRSPQQ